MTILEGIILVVLLMNLFFLWKRPVKVVYVDREVPAPEPEVVDDNLPIDVDQAVSQILDKVWEDGGVTSNEGTVALMGFLASGSPDPIPMYWEEHDGSYWFWYKERARQRNIRKVLEQVNQ